MWDGDRWLNNSDLNPQGLDADYGLRPESQSLSSGGSGGGGSGTIGSLGGSGGTLVSGNTAGQIVSTEDNADGSSSADDRLNQIQAADRVSVGDGCSESSQNLPTLRKDGPVENSGSVGHPNDCKPCAFYCFSLRGCRNGAECAYCHLFHESKLRQRREEWKKSQREKRGKQRAPQREQPVLAETLAEAGTPSDSGSLAEAPPIPKVAYTVEAVPPAPVREPAPKPAARAAEPVEAPSRNTAARAQRRVPEAGLPVAGPAPPPVATPAVANWCSVGMQAQHTAALGISRNSMATNPMPMRAAPLQPVLQPQSVQTLAPQRYPGTILNGDTSLREPLEALATTTVFMYTPNTAVIGVGQTLELWPPEDILFAGMVFAVSPDLPRGLTLDERMGVVHGKAQEGTLGMVKYYITACEPGDSSLSVKIAVVGLKVMDAQAPGHKMKSACELKFASKAQQQVASVA